MECFPSKVFPALQQSTRYLHNNMIRAHPLQYGHNLLSRTYCKSPFCNISATFFTKRARSLSKPVCRSSYLQQHDLILPTQHQCLPMIIGNVPAGATCHVTSTQPISNILFQSNIGGFLISLVDRVTLGHQGIVSLQGWVGNVPINNITVTFIRQTKGGYCLPDATEDYHSPYTCWKTTKPHWLPISIPFSWCRGKLCISYCQTTGKHVLKQLKGWTVSLPIIGLWGKPTTTPIS